MDNSNFSKQNSIEYFSPRCVFIHSSNEPTLLETIKKTTSSTITTKNNKKTDIHTTYLECTFNNEEKVECKKIPVDK